MVDSWLNVWKFISSQFGVPGAIIAAICVYLVWALKVEREDHKETRKKVDEMSDKRVLLMESYLNVVKDVKVSLDAVEAITTKVHEALLNLKGK